MGSFGEVVFYPALETLGVSLYFPIVTVSIFMVFFCHKNHKCLETRLCFIFDFSRLLKSKTPYWVAL